MRLHTFSRSLGWLTLGALLALSPQIIGCDSSDDAEKLESKKLEATPPVKSAESAAPVKGTPIVDATLTPVSEPKKVVTTEVKAAPSPEEKAPLVKRLVIASAVEEREPVEMKEGAVNQPVVAFLELGYKGEENAKVVVTFEHEGGTKVGFIELEVPARSARYRTWGRTKNIQMPGAWTAIVTTPNGNELARQSFTVAG